MSILVWGFSATAGMQGVGVKLVESGLSVVDSMLVCLLSSLTSLSGVAEASVRQNIFQPALQPHPQKEPTRSAAEC